MSGHSVSTRMVCYFIFVLAAIVTFHHNERRALSLSYGGYCTRCDTHHVLPTTDDAKQAALHLRHRMIQSGRIDIDELPVEEQERLLSSSVNSSEEDDDDENRENFSTISIDENQSGNFCLDVKLDPLLATEKLYERRGKMFGVLVCEAPCNNSRKKQEDVVILKAYAGKLGGQWNLPGWAPLVGKVPESIPEFRRKSAEVTKLFEKIESLEEKNTENNEETASIISLQIKELLKERSRLSTLCIEEIKKHQVLNNFRGIRMPIQETFAKGPNKLPGGTGDCAAPKLVAQAVQLGLKPIGICEIFVGATGGMSTTKKDGDFYDACEPRCQQIAGYMLCGLDI